MTEEKMGAKEVAIKIIKKNVDVKGIAFDIIDEVLEPALDKVVADSSNKLDDMLKASIYPTLEEKMKELIAEKFEEILK